MKVNVTGILKQMDGEDLPDPAKVDDDGKILNEPLTVRAVLVNSLMSTIPSRKAGVPPVNLDGKKKLEKYRLACRIQDSDEVNLISEEVVQLKDLVNEFYGVIVVGQILELLEKADRVDDKKEEKDAS